MTSTRTSAAKMQDFQVSVDLLLSRSLTTRQAEELLVALVPQGAALAPGPRLLEIVLSADAPTLTAAVTIAIDAVSLACETAGIPHQGVSRAEVRTAAAAATAPDSRPSLELVGVQEIAAIIGVSRARVYQLRQNHPDFPSPVADLTCGAIWERGQVDTFLAGWDRSHRRNAPRS